MGDDEHCCAVWEHILMPTAKEFRPDLVLISAGLTLPMEIWGSAMSLGIALQI
jgi:hypothetical protein